MFQRFDSEINKADTAQRVRQLRTRMTELGIDAFLVPRSDEYQNEYVPASAERLRWLSGFSGSAGVAVIARRHAALFVDGRYTVQARAEADSGIFEFPGIARSKLEAWLKEKLARGSTIGFDPWLHTTTEITFLTAKLAEAGIALKPLANNPVDRIWGRDRPPRPLEPVAVHPLKYAGQPAEEKIAAIQKAIKDAHHDALVLTLPESIAWTLNIRGADVPHNPVALAFSVVPSHGKPELFIDGEKLSREVRGFLDPLVKISAPVRLKARLAALRKAGKKVRVDANTAAHWFTRTLGKKSSVQGADPSIALRAIKNDAEIRGARAAHKRDGVALARFLAWLDHEAPHGTLDEITAVERLEQFRADTRALKEISFDTISGSGPNGAIVHYRVTRATNRNLGRGELFLIDSGAQYQDGTTDVTRTVAIGTPTAEMRECFTLVLKGHIAVATARFPKGTRGIDLDPFARRALWEKGLDYDHGTGHGVGSYLSVHEGPQSISRAGMTALEPGMICSNEPGYYKEGHYGIRIENVVLVKPPEKLPGSDRETMSFETLTLVPIDRRLIDKGLLTSQEIAWLDAYHARVSEVVGPDVDAATRTWLARATAPL